MLNIHSNLNNGGAGRARGREDSAGTVTSAWDYMRKDNETITKWEQMRIHMRTIKVVGQKNYTNLKDFYNI